MTQSPSSSVTTRHILVEVDKLVANPWNPNRMTAALFAKLDESIEQYGMVDPLTVRSISDKFGQRWQILDGEHRFNVARQRGYTQFDCTAVSGLTEAQAKKLTIIMNELHGQADPDKMGSLLQDILALSSLDDLLVALPYDESVLAGFIGAAAPLPDLPDSPVTAGPVATDKEPWVERTFRMPKTVGLIVDEAIEKALDGESLERWQGLERVAADYLAG